MPTGARQPRRAGHHSARRSAAFADFNLSAKTHVSANFGERAIAKMIDALWIEVMFAIFTDTNQPAFELLPKTRVVRAAPLSENPAYNGPR